MTRILPVIFLFFVSFLACAQTGQESANAPVTIPETVDVVPVIIFAIIFFGLIAGYFWWMWWSEKKRNKKQDEPHQKPRD